MISTNREFQLICGDETSNRLLSMSPDSHNSRTWLEDFYAAGDALEANRWISKYWAADAQLEFGGAPAIKGSTAIEELFTARFGALDSMKHSIVSIDVFPDKIYHETEVTYVVKGDSSEVVLRALTVFGKNWDEDRISYSHSYLDPGPLKKRIDQITECKGEHA